MASHPLTNFEVQKYYKNEPRFEGVYLRNYILKIIDGVYVINLNEYKPIGAHSIALHVNGDNKNCCDSSGIEYIPKEIKKIIDKQKILELIFL